MRKIIGLVNKSVSTYGRVRSDSLHALCSAVLIINMVFPREGHNILHSIHTLGIFIESPRGLNSFDPITTYIIDFKMSRVILTIGEFPLTFYKQLFCILG